ncbi:hypothetical protein BDZ97DRAFT_1788774 [Flammula alnicola]|nr:hypothetical protein BDZ97DRAFT_1788774 [Flammula alnicola]
MMDGDGEIKWGPHVQPKPIDLTDPQLTPIGIEQAHTIQRAWMEEATAGLSPPHKRYCSPLSRTLDACDIMLNKVFSEQLQPVLILEVCAISRHRTIRQFSLTNFKNFREENGDQLWHPTIRETKAEVAQRAGKTDTEHTFISLTAHGGFVNGFLTAIGRRPVPLPTVGVMSVLVKASTLQIGCGSALSFF